MLCDLLSLGKNRIYKDGTWTIYHDTLVLDCLIHL